jgi:predicted transcriptional regulator YdeE
MPDVVKKPWTQIWAMSPHDLGGKRAFLADFEIYDERANDHQNIVLDIYIGILPPCLASDSDHFAGAGKMVSRGIP